MAQVSGLDEAWAEAEAAWKALGEGDGSALILGRYSGRRPEIAYEADLFVGRVGIVKSAATPAAALRLVAAEARAAATAATAAREPVCRDCGLTASQIDWSWHGERYEGQFVAPEGE